jgi:hypothetical protein
MPPADAPRRRGAQRAALFAYYDHAAQQVVVETGGGAEVGHLDQAAARRLGKQLLAAACDQAPAPSAAVLAADDHGEELVWRGEDGAELGRLGWLDALALAEELLAASNGEATGNEPVPVAAQEVDLVVSPPAGGRGLDTVGDPADGDDLLRRLDRTLRARGLGSLGAVDIDDDRHDLVWWVAAAGWQAAAWEVVRAGLAEHGLLHWAHVVACFADGDARRLWPPDADQTAEPTGLAVRAPAAGRAVRPGGGRPWSARPWARRPASGPRHRRP